MDKRLQTGNPEIWGGIECTINRVNDIFYDQLHCTGHYHRESDIERFAALGITVLRYPVLWERHEPVQGQPIDWSWTEKQLNNIRAHGIKPIAGLVHHGSGPSYTHLADASFAEGLAAYARKVAGKFPWLEYYTPVNEPLTTARFSGLYGLWYPHHQNALSFASMLLNQLKGTVLAMGEIRKINPDAKLIQTEDLTRIHSTKQLRYQADFENERRWLTFDLLCGRVNRKHPLWSYFMSIGIKEQQLQFFLENPCPPDIIGVNYYVTSERYLDHRIDRHPPHTHGGNDRQVYADVEAVRVIRPAGISQLLKETWDRYRMSITVTEAHLHCTREEQLRWFREIWHAAVAARKKGIDVRAVTAWSLLGAFDWNSLLTRRTGHYESGVFDVRDQSLRPTALGRMITALATNKQYHHPLLQEKGWWHYSHRHGIRPTPAVHTSSTPPLLVIGKTGTLGNAFARMCNLRNIPFRTLSREDVNILDTTSIERAIDQYKPWAVINASGYVRLDDAESNVEQCFAVNAQAPALLADACGRHGIQFMTFSSDQVFDGNKHSPYIETDHTQPLNIYGRSKAAGETGVIAANPGSLIVRTSAFFGPWDQYNFVYHVLQALCRQNTFEAVSDVVISPTYTPDLVNAALDLLIDEGSGIWHISNDGSLTWADLAFAVAERGGFGKKNITTKTMSEMNWKAKRPGYSVLESRKGIRLPSLDDALGRYFEEKIL